MTVWLATLSYWCLYLSLVQCKIVNLHFRDFPLETVATNTFISHSNFPGSGWNLVTRPNVLRGSQMPVDIQRVITGVVIVTCCNMNPLSCWKILSSCYRSQCLRRSFDDSIKEFAVLSLYTDSVTSSVAEYWSILASRLNPAHQCDWEPCVQIALVRKLDVAAISAIKHVRSAWFVVGSGCNRNISQDST